MNEKIVFANATQVLLFNEELSGQISDGHWENATPYDHYERPCRAEVTWHENPDRQGINFTRKRKYNFASASLLDAVGERMLDIVKASRWMKQYFFPENKFVHMFVEAAQGYDVDLQIAKALIAEDEITVFNRVDEASKACRALYELKLTDKTIELFAQNEYCRLQEQYRLWRDLHAAGINLAIIDEFYEVMAAENYSMKELKKELKEMTRIFNS